LNATVLKRLALVLRTGIRFLFTSTVLPDIICLAIEDSNSLLSMTACGLVYWVT
jgi:hypothetical protein